jgi:hypothetical protein
VVHNIGGHHLLVGARPIVRRVAHHSRAHHTRVRGRGRGR